MGLDLIRDSTVGQVINYISKGRLLPYADQRPGYVVPTRFLTVDRKQKEIGSDAVTLCEEESEKKRQSRGAATPALERANTAATLSGVQSLSASGTTTPSPAELERASTPATLTEKPVAGNGVDIPDPYLVDWEENDPDDPQYVPFLSLRAALSYLAYDRNWSFRKRAFVAFEISLLTFSVYIGSAIYTSSIPGIMQEFNVSLVMATLGLTLYVLGRSRRDLS